MDWFPQAFLVEFEIAERQVLALAEAMPAEKFSWRPDTARSVSEALVHIAAGNFFLLAAAGRTAPVEIYGNLAVTGPDAWQAFARRNDELEKTMTEKPAVVDFLKRSFQAVRESLNEKDGVSFEVPHMRGIYMRLLAHGHEHMGQMIAYTRVNGLPVPWHDWRPDRRTT